MNTQQHYLCFIINEQNFAIPLSSVVEVLVNKRIDKVPKASAFINGIISFRGEMISVIDILLQYGNEVTKGKTILILEWRHNEKKLHIGILISKVKHVIAVKKEAKINIPEFGLALPTEIYESVFYIHEQPFSELKIEKLFLLN